MRIAFPIKQEPQLTAQRANASHCERVPSGNFPRNNSPTIDDIKTEFHVPFSS